MISRAEWTDVELDEGYKLTLRVIGGGIIHSRPRGFVTVEGVRRALQLIDRVHREGIGARRRWVHLSDYSLLRGASIEARRVFIEGMRDRSGLLGVVFCGVSPLFRLSIKLARRLHVVRMNVALSESFGDAALEAAEMLRGGRAVPSQASEGSRAEEGETPRGHEQQIERRAAWVSYEVIDDDTLLGVARGFIGVEDVDEIVAHSVPLVAGVRRRAGRVNLMMDLGDLEGVSHRARLRFVEALRTRDVDMGMDLLVCFGASRLIKGAIYISRPFLPFRIKATKDLESAIEVVRQHGPPSGTRRDEPIPESGSDDPSASHVDQMLRFLANIEWEAAGLAAAEDALAPDNPLAPICDAMVLVKAELDQLLRERRMAGEALRLGEERYRTILENILEGYYEVDLEGRVVFCNESLARILGYSAEEMTGLDSRSYMDRNDYRKVVATFNRVYESGEPETALDWEFVRKDGRRIPVETSISLVVGPDGRRSGFRGIVRDITERVAAERERERLEAQLRNAQRMEAIGRLAGGIAHNFNNLLMGIQGNVSLLSATTERDAPIQSRLATIQELVEGGSRLTSQLLGCARAGRYEVQPVDLNELLRTTAETFALTRKDIRIHMEPAGDLPPALADRHQIEQVLLNLMINAADAMPGGGDLYFASRPCTAAQVSEIQPGVEPVEYVATIVRDQGCGMDPETLERIFEPFFSTKGLSGGTGLGLASAYGIVEAHGGFIDVSSTPGEGTEFTVFLPVAVGAETPEADEPPEMVSGLGTVLVVEDDRGVLEATVAMLELLRYTPLPAATGLEAIEVFEDRGAEVDLVLLDLILPDMNGEKVYERLRAMAPSVRVLLSSGYSLDGEAARLLERGCLDFIQKPYTIEVLSEKMATVMAGDRDQEPGISLDSR